MIGGIRRLLDWSTPHWLWLHYPELRTAFAVPSHLTRAERVKLYELASGCRNVAEIGSYIGASACCFGESMLSQSRAGGRLYCIDTWNNESMTEGLRDTWAEFQKNTARYSELITPIRGFSTDVVAQLGEQTDALDLLFIDGDHAYSAVKADWEHYERFLATGSIVVFHDCAWAEGVQRVIEEDAKPRVAEFDALPNLWWGRIR